MFKLTGNTTENKNSKRNLLKRAVIVFAVVTVVSATVTVSAYNYNKAAAYKKSAAEASSECDEVIEDIEKKEELIDGKGFYEYCEKIAREKYGYAKPGEYVIYDSSYGN